MSTQERTIPKSQNVAVRRGLWVLGSIMAAGISIAAFSIASGLIVA